MEYLFIYCLQLFDRLDVINFMLWFIGIIGCIALAITTCVYLSATSYYSEMKAPIKMGKKWVARILTLAIITMIIPTKQTLLFMGGLYLGKKAVNSVVTDEKIKKIDTIINLELDKRVKELQKEVK